MNDLKRTNALLSVLAVVAIGFLLLFLRDVLVPLAGALFLSYLGMPVMRVGKILRVPVAASSFLVIVFFGMTLGGIALVFYDGGAQFVEESPQYFGKVTELIDRSLEKTGIKGLVENLESGSTEAPKEGTEAGEPPLVVAPVKEHTDWFDVFQSGNLWSFATGVLGGINDLSMLLFFLFFIMLDRGHESLDRRLIAAFSREGTESARPTLEQIHKEIELYILTKVGISLFTGIMVTSVLAIFDMPLALLFGLLALVLNFVPYVGSILACIPPAIVAFVHYDPLWDAVPVLATLVVIQVAIGNVIEPLVMGRRLHLNPITVLVSLVVWGSLWGIWGVVLAVPLATTMRIILERSENLRPLGALMRDD